jgi:hypothetical protein
MNDNLVSYDVFVWFISIFTAGVAGTWLVYDALKLWWLRGADKTDPMVHDKRFGYGLGLFVGLIGVLGVVKFHL